MWWHSLPWLFSRSWQGSSTNIFRSSAPSFDIIVNRLCGLWASLKKLVSQSVGSLLAEGQGHISMEVACLRRFGSKPTQAPLTPLKGTLWHWCMYLRNILKSMPSHVKAHSKYEISTKLQRCREDCTCFLLTLPSLLSLPFYLCLGKVWPPPEC